MINQLFLVGKIKRLPMLDNVLGGNDFILEVKRNYKNVDGVFEKDNFRCHLWIAISKKITLSCKEGDIVAVKGRLVDENDSCKIVAEQVILLNKVCGC